MIRLFAVVGKFALFLAAMAVLTFVSFFVVGAYLASWPILRVSPRHRRVQSVMGLTVAAMSVARAYGLTDRPPATEPPEATEPEPIYPYADGPFTIIGPECFVGDPDGTGPVISWQGHNFIPQPDPERG